MAAGAAGDMLLAALLDAGADLAAVNGALAACGVGAAVRTEPVTRAGLRARALAIDITEPEGTERTLRDCLHAVGQAAMPARAAGRAADALRALGEAEAGVHGSTPDAVHLHELSAVDTLVDVVGVCVALESLDAAVVTASPLPAAWGTVATAHGELPLPVPATLALLERAQWPVVPGVPGVEQVTPTGAALVTTLATAGAPALRLRRVGVGAGTRDDPRRPNVVRAWVGDTLAAAAGSDVAGFDDPAVELRCNLDDISPAAVAALATAALGAGALDAWVVPALLRKGRPGHVLHLLAAPAAAEALADLLLESGATLGVRATGAPRRSLERDVVEVDLDGVRVRVKRRHRGGRVVDARPELDDCARIAQGSGRPLHVVVDELTVAARRMLVEPAQEERP